MAAADSDRRATKKNIADKVLRRRSFVKEKPSLTSKISLSSVTSRGVVLVETPGQPVDNRFGDDLTLPVNETKGSILKLLKTLKRGTVPAKPRGNNDSDFILIVCYISLCDLSLSSLGICFVYNDNCWHSSRSYCCENGYFPSWSKM